MTGILSYLLLFTAVGVAFVLVNLLVGKLVRPNKPDPEKMEIYECGEPTVGSSWVQFDLRYYVIALLFVIFDVEVAFFFPWATVYGKLNALADTRLTAEQREEVRAALVPAGSRVYEKSDAELIRAGRQLAWIALFDILVFFGVLLVGYAYLWRRGDLDWVRSTEGEKMRDQLVPRPPPELTLPQELVTVRQAG